MHSNVMALHSRELTTEHQRLAEIIEMIHTASLIHDDVIDDSGMRRGMQIFLDEQFSCIVDTNHPLISFSRSFYSLIENLRNNCLLDLAPLLSRHSRIYYF
jgi:geranylgeranyl pyrophosphate synthase